MSNADEHAGKHGEQGRDNARKHHNKRERHGD
jgi:hypothetical protein